MTIISKGHSFLHIHQKTGQAPKRPKRTTLQGQQQLQQTTTQDISTTKQEKGLLKQINLNINISKLLIKADKFQGGNLRNKFLAWTNITSDTFILNNVQQGLKLSFTGDILKRSQLEQSIIDEEVRKPIRKKVIITTHVQEGNFFSNLFIRSKRDGSYRTILNLKKLNQDCETTHFKMESMKPVIHMIKPNMYLASLDIKDAFYTGLIYETHRKYLKFI